MTLMQDLYQTIDELSPQDLNRLRLYIDQRQKYTYFRVTSEQMDRLDEIMRLVQADAEQYAEEEVNRWIDQTLQETRNARAAINRKSLPAKLLYWIF